MLKQFITVIAVFTIGGNALLVPAHSRATAQPVNAYAAQPDLRIKQFLFSPANDKTMKVHILNSGNALSQLCFLRLTVRKINGVPVGRVTEVKLPPLAPGKDTWLVINAKSILPNNISLESTTFKLNADATSIVGESDEGNNEVWHNL